jgi:hypothetical protein
MRAATCTGLGVLLASVACGPLELTLTVGPPGDGDRAPSDAAAAVDPISAAADAGARADDRAQAATQGADAASATVDGGRPITGPACTEHDDCDDDQICDPEQGCVEGCLPENEACDPGGDERCCEHFHCCPVFHICVPNWWE